jgi:signal transduction histidine kinase
MTRTTYEPGLLPVFRFLTGMELILLIVLLRLQSETLTHPPYVIWYLTWSALIVPAAVLLGFLSFKFIQRKVGSYYLPAALAIASIGPILTQYLLINMRLKPGFLYDVSTSAWQSVMILFIPLVILAWQYSYRRVVQYCLVTSLASLVLMLLTPNVTDAEQFSFLTVLFIRTLLFLLVGYMITRLLKAQREQRQALAQANTKLAHYAAALEELTISRERNRMARELHDTLAHTLSSQAVQLEAIKALWKMDSEHAYEMVEQTLQGARRGLKETRRAIQALRASPLEDLGLPLAVCNLAENAAARGGMKLQLDVSEIVEGLSPDIEQALYRISQEALENLVRYSQARNLQVSLTQRSDRVELLIQDDGIGFQPDLIDRDHHYGLRGMLERAEGIGGQLEVSSQSGKGTLIRCTVGEKR